MKPAAITGMLLLFFVATARAQLTLLPQAGFDRSKTSVSVNDLSSFSPMGAIASFKASLRLDYRFKSGHGPYVALGTSSGPVAYSFENPSAAINNYKVYETNKLLQMEAGYQYSFKPIRLSNNSTKKSTAKPVEERQTYRSSCGSYYKSHCGSQKQAMAKKSNTTLRIQPSAGLAYHPASTDEFSIKGTSYQYNAGAWKTALVTGTGFEFGRGNHRLFTLSVFYSHPLGKENSTLNAIENTKPVITNFSSKTSNWGMTLGVPISLSKTQKQAKKTETKQNCQTRSETRTHCTRRI